MHKQAIEWAQTFAQCVRNKDFHAALHLFSPKVHSYGTRVVEACNRNQLHEGQWTPTWHRTQGFDYLPGSMDVQLSSDASVAIVCALWRSEGVDSPESWGLQQPYERSGRCTFVLTKNHQDAWVCTHSHFSLNPGQGPN